MTEQRIYKRYSTAHKHANGGPVVRVGDLYIIGLNAFHSVEIIAPDGIHAGNIRLAKLNELANANWAAPTKDSKEWENKHTGKLFPYPKNT